MPTQADVDVATTRRSFTTFQRKLELGAHVDVHVAVGGTMNSGSSPADPLFWLHHANIDRLWAQWQSDYPQAKTPHGSTVLQPAPLFGVKVASQLDITTLGYSYT